ncbi:pseudouridine synthase [Gynuella sunshinyii YC6258]|uniref:tRNA pseudouridine synthase B n=2 Tax=Gynuella sunshinyii TaxID=1445505 RepID=A0A0C5W3T4_9GAMM|nr:pseudouridine synthase [Gynuella sunshinyii YC6258]
MSRKRKGNPIHGVVLVNKPAGQSSNAVLQQVKRYYQAQKAGHTGALDPLATGLLPVCLGEATKFSQLLLDSDKTYQTTAVLGVRTDTCDADGQVVEEKDIPADVTTEKLQALIAEHLTGGIQQVAPLYSALKVNGRPMYELARAGVEVEAKIRPVTIFRFEVLAVHERTIDLEIHCSKGTYIRSLVDELGQLLGCGAHVSRLHRIQHGPYQLQDAVRLEQLQQFVPEQLQEQLLPVDSMITQWPIVWLTEDQVIRFCHGNPVSYPDMPEMQTAQIRVYDQQAQKMIGIGRAENGLIKPVRLINWD